MAKAATNTFMDKLYADAFRAGLTKGTKESEDWFRKKLAKVTLTLTLTEKYYHSLQCQVPKFINQTEKVTKYYRNLDEQIQQVQKILALMNLASKIWADVINQQTETSTNSTN